MSLPTRATPKDLKELFWTFSAMAAMGFGGVLPWAQRALVERKNWLSREEFVDLLAFAQLMPGPNICNVALMLGDRYFGWRGALVALLGMFAVPIFVVMSLALLYSQYREVLVVKQAMTGMSAVCAGMIMATAAKMAVALKRQWQWLGIGVIAFLAVIVLHIKVAIVVLILAPLAVGLAYWKDSR
jgi:chromate transporter